MATLAEKFGQPTGQTTLAQKFGTPESEQPTTLGQKAKSLYVDPVVGATKFMGKDVLGMTKPQDVSYDGSLGGVLPMLGKELFQSTLGSKGVSGLLSMPARVAASPLTRESQQLQTESAISTTDQALAYIYKAREYDKTDPKMAAKFRKAASDLQVRSLEASVRAGQIGDTAPTQGQIAGTTFNSALTALMVNPGGVLAAGSILPKGSKAAQYLAPLASGTSNISKGLAVTRLAGRVAENALLGAGFNAANNLYEGRPAGENAGVASIFGGAIPIAGTLAHSVVSKTPQALIRQAERMYQSAMKPVGDAAAKSRVVKTGLREGIVLSEGGIEKTTARIDALEQKVGAVIDEAGAAGKTIKTSTLKSYVDEAKNFFANITDVQFAAKAVQEIDDIYNNFVRMYGEDLPVQKAQELKVATYQWLKNSYGELAGPVKEGNKQLVRGLKEGIAENAPVIGQINERLKALYEFDAALERSMGRVKNTNLLGLGTKILGATGNKYGTILALGNQVLGALGNKSRLAIYLYKFGEAMSVLDPITRAEIFFRNPALKDVWTRVFGNSPEMYGPIKPREAPRPPLNVPQKPPTGLMNVQQPVKPSAIPLGGETSRGAVDAAGNVIPPPRVDSVTAVPAKKGAVGVNPKTKKFMGTYQSGQISPQAGSTLGGAAVGATAGFEKDENGNTRYDWKKGMAGMLVGAGVGYGAGKIQGANLPNKQGGFARLGGGYRSASEKNSRTINKELFGGEFPMSKSPKGKFDPQIEPLLDEFGGVYRPQADIIEFAPGKRVFSDVTKENGELYLSEFGVSEGARGTGIGRQYIDALKKYADETQTPLTVYKMSSDGAKKFWRKMFPEGEGVNWGEYGDSVKYTPSVKKPTKLGEKGDSLEAQARNYKTAEEFVKAQPTYYHQSQSKTPFDDFKQKGDAEYKKADYSQASEGIYFSPNKELVKNKYGQNGGTLLEVSIVPKKKLDLGTYDAMYFDGRKVQYGDVVTENFKRSMRGESELPEPDIILTSISKKAKTWLEKKGYDAVSGMEGEMFSAPELVVIDKSIIKTKSQLTDIWKKANEGKISSQKLSTLNEKISKYEENIAQGREVSTSRLYLEKAQREKSALMKEAGLTAPRINSANVASNNKTKETLLGTKRTVAPRERIGTTGQYIGAPGIKSPQALTAFRNRLTDSALRGAAAKDWYADSAKVAMDMFGGNKKDAATFTELLAIYSPGTSVDVNFSAALKAWNQFKSGQPIIAGRFGAMDKKATDLLVHGKEWGGRKTNSFYQNMVQHIDPSLGGAKSTTVDLWMMRGLGYKVEHPSPQQYNFAEKEIRRVANTLGWSEEQAQAAMWFDFKVKALGKPIHELEPRGFMDAAKKTEGQLSWEAAPSKSIGLFPELHSAPMPERLDYHAAVDKIFYDEQGNDLVAKMLGIPVMSKLEAPGVFKGQLNPGTQFIIPMPKQHKGVGIDAGTKKLIDEYAAIRGLYSQQDAVAYHRPFYDTNVSKRNGISIDLGRPISDEEALRLDQAIQRYTGSEDFAPISANEGARILNFDFLSGMDNATAYGKIRQAILEVFPEDAKIGRFASDGDYISNDWTTNIYGEDYRNRIGARSPDLLRRSDALFAKKAEGVFAEFGKKYGWTDGRKAKLTDSISGPTQLGEKPSSVNLAQP